MEKSESYEPRSGQIISRRLNADMGKLNADCLTEWLLRMTSNDAMVCSIEQVTEIASLPLK